MRFLIEFAWPAIDPDDRLTTARRRIVSSFSLLAVIVSVIEGLVWFDEMYGLSPARAHWTFWNSFVYLVPPFVLWHSGRVQFASSLLVAYFVLSLGIQILSPVGEVWAMALYFFVIPPISMLLLGTRIGVVLSCLAVVSVILLTNGTVPKPVGTILVNVTTVTAIGMLIFISEAENTTQYLDNLRREAQSANQAKSFFLANVSHEIRTPLNGILGAVQLLHEQAETREQKELLLLAEKSGESLLRMVNDILDFSKITQRGLQLEKIAFRKEDLVDNVFSALSSTAEQKGITLSSHFGEGIPDYMIGDPVRLSQIVMNFVSNAVKFSDQGTVEVRFDRLEDANMVKVRVIDRGIGMTAEAAARVFDAFEQAENSTARHYGGTGLGLSIARQLAELHGGEIGVDSAQGAGSTFWFTFPLIEAEAPPEQQEPDPPPPRQHQQYHNARVLLVEDNKTNQFIARKFLLRLGVDPVIANDGCEAVEIAQQQPFDLIFMDIQMPKKTGIEATQEIRADAGPNRSTPILALSANAMADQKAAYLQAGMNDCLEKPCKFDTMARSLARYIAPSGDQTATQ